MGLMAAIGRGPVALDTVAIIYFIEEHPLFLPLIAPIFDQVDSGQLHAVTSAVTLLEVLVIPYRAGNLALASRYEELLTRSRGFHTIELDRAQLRAAAQLRALYRLRTPDALQLAAALSQGCSSLVTNDRDLPALPNLRIIQLRDYLSR